MGNAPFRSNGAIAAQNTRNARSVQQMWSNCLVTTGHSRSKNGVALLAYDPVVHTEMRRRSVRGLTSENAARIAGSSPAMTKHA
jgi:hypothetical protein